MQKFYAILLLFCFSLHQLGYLAANYLIPKWIDAHWEQQIWNSDLGQEGELIRIPFPMPYGQDQEDFQPVNLSMEIDGEWKRVIRQRYFQDHLEVIVITDSLEEKWSSQFQKWISTYQMDSNQDEIPPLEKLLLKSFSKNFIFENQSPTISSLTPTDFSSVQDHYKPPHSEYHPDLHSPPPKN